MAQEFEFESRKM